MAPSSTGKLVVRSKRAVEANTVSLPRKRRRITRRSLPHEKIFPFLSLPPELRNFIYNLCVNMDGIATYLNEFVERYKNCVRPKQIRPKPTLLKTPTILLLNRQIHSEAVGNVKSMALTFDHGIFTHLPLVKLICGPALRRVRSITITADSEEITSPLYGVQSWCGYVNLFRRLAWHLKSKHSLQELNISFPQCDHTGYCWTGNWSCGFRDCLREALETMLNIRGVKNVCITGLPEDITQQLTRRMTTAPVGLLSLPRELRDMIYDKVVGEWPDVSAGMKKMMVNRITTLFSRPPYPKLTTPGILLVSRAISKEALERRDMIFDKQLVIAYPNGYFLQRVSEVPSILEFLPLHMVQRMKHLTLDIPSWRWAIALPGLVSVLSQRHSLETVTIKFHDELMTDLITALGGSYPDIALHECVGHLANITDVGRVIFQGNLPKCYTKPMEMIMEGKYHGKSVPLIFAQSFRDGKLVVLPNPCTEAFRLASNPSHDFQGSISLLG